MKADSKIAVVGAGSWGTAFANALSLNGLRVTLWSRREELARSIRESNENPDYLPGIGLSPRLRSTSDLGEAVGGAALVVMGVPSQGFRQVLREAASSMDSDVPIVSLAKGLELQTLNRMSEVIVQEIPAAWPRRVVVLTGPNLAGEIARGLPAASVIACADHDIADQIQALFMSPTFRTYSISDVVGAEIGGVVKNVIAVGTGMVEGLKFGDNTKALTITRGLAEMSRLGAACGADPLTFAGLAGVGDMICTCMSGLSRNHRVGLALGQGRKIADVVAGMSQVAEGVNASKAVHDLASKHEVELPICEAVYRVVHEGQEVSDAISDLLRIVRVRERD